MKRLPGRRRSGCRTDTRPGAAGRELSRPSRSKENDGQPSRRSHPMRSLQPAESAIEPQPSQHRDRRHRKQIMPHPRETRAMDDHAADQRQQRRQRHKSRFPSPAFTNRAGGVERQRTEKERQARADDQRQRKLDADIGRNIPARNIRHPVNVACKNSVDRILEIIESRDRAQRVERSQAGPRPRPDHDHVGNDERRGERECGTAGERKRRTGGRISEQAMTTRPA